MKSGASITCDNEFPVDGGLTILWHAYHDKLLGFIQGRVESRDVAEDILQDVFIKIQKGMAALQDNERLENWIYQIVRNAIIDHYRKRKAFEELPQALVAPETDEEEMTRRDLSTCLLPMIEVLPPTYRDALRLSLIDGLKQKQIAEKLGLSLSGAKSRVQRGRAMIRNVFLDCCHIELDHRGTMVAYESKGPNCSCGT